MHHTLAVWLRWLADWIDGPVVVAPLVALELVAAARLAVTEAAGWSRASALSACARL
jgi:hypothetical protein